MHDKSITQVIDKLKTRRLGLTTVEVESRLEKFGLNKMPRSGEQVTKLGIFFTQWKSPLIIILVLAGAVSGVLGEYIDMTVIFITVGVNVLIGFFQ